MNKIKRQYVEDLYHATELYYQETQVDRSSETAKNAFMIMFELDAGLHDFFDKERACFVNSIVECFVGHKMSISRLLKCLEVCGIEVVE